ncbi:MAG: hypothetical protein RIR51_514 [Bacteroidota bacterium]|jgi:RND family efflux transporter MFP subunit
MKKFSIILSSILLFAACSQEVDKNQELAELKVQAQEIQLKIKQLESEIGNTSSNSVEKVVPVVVSPLSPLDFKHMIESQGMVEAENSVLISPKAPGSIVTLKIKEGDYVKKGQIVAIIDNKLVREQLAELKYQLDVAKVVYDKQKALWDQKIGTEIQFINAKASFESLSKRISTLNAQLDLYNVIAPISGVIERVNQKEGEIASPGMPIAQVINLNNLKVVSHVSDTFLGTVNKGDEVVMNFPDINKEMKGRISFVGNLVNPATRTFDIEVSIPSSNQFHPNQYAVVKINDITLNKALVIDQNLVQITEKGNLIYVAEQKDGKNIAISKQVELGLSYNGQVEIKSGLEPGDQIITTGYQDVVDGTQISF